MRLGRAGPVLLALIWFAFSSLVAEPPESLGLALGGGCSRLLPFPLLRDSQGSRSVTPCHPPPRCGSCMSPWHRLVGFHLKNRGRDVWGLKAPCLVWVMVEETRGGRQVCVSPCGVRADKWCLCPNTLWQEGTRWGVCSVLCHRGAGRRAQHLHAHYQGVFQGFSCRFRDAASWSGQVRGSY